MNPFRFLAPSRSRAARRRSRPTSTRLHIESLERRTLLAIDALAAAASPWQNAAMPSDVNADGHVTGADALAIINELNAGGARSLAASISRDALLASSLRTAADTAEAAPMYYDTNGDGMLTGLDALLVINQLNNGIDPRMRFRLETTDLSGNPITQIAMGEDFQLRALVSDLRTIDPDDAGVFQAFTDVTFDAALATVAGAIMHASDYINGISGSTATDGLLDEVGALATSTIPYGPNDRLLFSVTLHATAVGTLTFTADPADFLPAHDTLLHGESSGVPTNEIDYGTVSLDITGPTITIDSPAAVTENDGTTNIDFTVTLSEISTVDVTVHYSTVNGSATAGQDYVAQSDGMLTIPAGQISGVISIALMDDARDESPVEDFLVRLSNALHATIATAEATGNILDNDPPPTLSIGDAALFEGDSGTTMLSFTVTLSAASGLPVSFDYRTSDDSAAAGADYTAVDTENDGTGPVTIAPGMTSKTVIVALHGDTDVEPDETFHVTLLNPDNATLADAEAVGTIVNDDVPTVSIDSPAAVTENNGTTDIDFTVSLSSVFDQDVMVHYSTANGTATAGQDYVAQSDGILTILAGQTSGVISIELFDDGIDEPDQTFTVMLSDAVNATIVSGTGTGTILDDDDAPSVSIAAPEKALDEGGVLEFTVSLAAASEQQVTVDFTTVNGSARAGSDYTANMGTLTFAPLDTTKTIQVTLLDDARNESPVEDFLVRLSNAVNATIATAEATGNVLDNDLPPTLSIGDAQIAEGNSGTTMLSFTVTLSAASGLPVGFDYRTSDITALAGIDYTAVDTDADGTGPVIIAPGMTSATIMVALSGDTDVEPNETFHVTLFNPDNAALDDAEAVGTILDDDGHRVRIDSPEAVTENNGVTNIEFTVTLSMASTEDVIVPYSTTNGTATAGQDYVAPSNGMVTIPAGQLTATIAIVLMDDTLDEVDETFTVTLGTPTGAIVETGMGTGTGTIVDDDPTPTVSIASSPAGQTENDGVTPINFTVTLSAVSGRDVIVPFSTANGTATAGQDFVAPSNGMVTIPAGQLTETISIALLDDALDEADESFTVTLGTPTGATVAAGAGTGTGTILDDGDEAPTVSINSPDPVAENAGPINFTVTLSAPSGREVVVPYSTVDGTANGGEDFVAQPSATLRIPAGQLTGTFAIALTNDLLAESAENFTVVLSTPTNATIAPGMGTGTGTINDDTDSTVPMLSIASPAAIVEGDTGTKQLVFTVTLSLPVNQQVQVDFSTISGTAIAGSDFTAAPANSRLTFAAMQTSQTITIDILSDIASESTETFQVQLSNPTGGVSIASAMQTATGTITDNDQQLVVLLSGPSLPVNESAGNMTFTVTLGAPSATALSVDFTTEDGSARAGRDYTAVNGTLMFSPGETSKTIQVPITNDALDESNTEELSVRLSNLVSATSARFAVNNSGNAITTATGQISDDDPMPTLSIADASIAEGNNGTKMLLFTVSLSAASGLPVSFDYGTANGTAMAGSDYTAINTNPDMGGDGPIVIPAGTTSMTIAVEISGDADIEPDETLQVTLAMNPENATLGRSTAVGTILDDDSPTFAGFVYDDLNQNGVKDSQETGIAGVLITLAGMDTQGNSVNLTQTTGADGAYRFTGLMPGDYTVTETHPQDRTDGIDTPGDASMTMMANDQFMLHLEVGAHIENSNFGENGLVPQAINRTLLFASRRR